MLVYSYWLHGWLLLSSSSYLLLLFNTAQCAGAQFPETSNDSLSSQHWGLLGWLLTSYKTTMLTWVHVCLLVLLPCRYAKLSCMHVCVCAIFHHRHHCYYQYVHDLNCPVPLATSHHLSIINKYIIRSCFPSQFSPIHIYNNIQRRRSSREPVSKIWSEPHWETHVRSF